MAGMISRLRQPGGRLGTLSLAAALVLGVVGITGVVALCIATAVGGNLWSDNPSAQLVSALASVLLLVPMFYLGREVFERRIAFWSCLLFQCLPTRHPPSRRTPLQTLCGLVRLCLRDAPGP